MAAGWYYYDHDYYRHYYDQDYYRHDHRDPVQELVQNYPDVWFRDLSELHKGMKDASLRRRRLRRNFRIYVEVWGWQFDKAVLVQPKVRKKDVKKAVAQEALHHLKNCVDEIGWHVSNKIERMVEEKYIKVSGVRENAEAIRKVLSAIVLERKAGKRSTMKVVALGTGTKCIASQNLNPNDPGKTVNDCHAEVIVKRAFRRYLYQQLSICFKQPERNSIFRYEFSSRKYVLKTGISFHMYISTGPCGDATECIGESDQEEDDHGARKNRGNARCKIEGGEGSVLAKKRIENGRLVIMSCSDKIASWNITGVQGALLSIFIKPIFLKSIIVGKNFNYTHMARAMYIRVGVVTENEGFPCSYKAPVPMVGKASSSRYQQATESRSRSLNWWDDDTKMAEVIDAPTGLTEDCSPSRLCKREMFNTWLGLMQHLPLNEVQESGTLVTDFDLTGNPSYGSVKDKATEYQSVKLMLQNHYDDYLDTWRNDNKLFEQNEFTL